MSFSGQNWFARRNEQRTATVTFGAHLCFLQGLDPPCNHPHILAACLCGMSKSNNHEWLCRVATKEMEPDQKGPGSDLPPDKVCRFCRRCLYCFVQFRNNRRLRAKVCNKMGKILLCFLDTCMSEHLKPKSGELLGRNDQDHRDLACFVWSRQETKRLLCAQPFQPNRQK